MAITVRDYAIMDVSKAMFEAQYGLGAWSVIDISDDLEHHRLVHQYRRMATIAIDTIAIDPEYVEMISGRAR